MSTVAEIEAAIKALPPTERERLADNLPSILPELDGDAKWQRIINDARPRPALTALGDEIAAQLKANPAVFSEMHDGGLQTTKVKSLGTEKFWQAYHALPLGIKEAARRASEVPRKSRAPVAATGTAAFRSAFLVGAGDARLPRRGAKI